MDPNKYTFIRSDGTNTVEYITNHFDQINMDLNQSNVTGSIVNQSSSSAGYDQAQLTSNSVHPSNASNNNIFATNIPLPQEFNDTPMMDLSSNDNQDDYCVNQMITNSQQQQQQQGNDDKTRVLIVTNVDSSVYNDNQVKSNFEALFRVYDPNVTFRYLRSFRRVRLDFTNGHLAQLARSKLSRYKIGPTEFKCYSAQIIKPNGSDTGDDDEAKQGRNSTFLHIPKLTKQFLISPPASPPVGWEPVTESSPCIDVQLISALANLVPGKVHEIHQGNESQPGIYVEVCEEPQFDASRLQKSCSRIPKTPSPSYF